MNKTCNMLKSAFYETGNFYFSSRVFAFHVIFFLIMLIYAEPVKSIAKMLNCKATPWILPFYSSSLYYNLIFLFICFFEHFIPFVGLINPYFIRYFIFLAHGFCCPDRF